MRILIVDDDFTARAILESALESKAELVMAEDGRQAIELFGAGILHKRPFRLVMMDLLMPRLDGISAIKGIRELERRHELSPRQRAKVVVITGDEDPARPTQAFFQAGADAFLTKPVDHEALVATIRSQGLL